MNTDTDLDIMNLIKDLPEENTAFYFRSDEKEGFFYGCGTTEGAGAALSVLMEQEESVRAMVFYALKEFHDEET